MFTERSLALPELRMFPRGQIQVHYSYCTEIYFFVLVVNYCPKLSFMYFGSISLEVNSLPVWNLYVPEVGTGFINLVSLWVLMLVCGNLRISPKTSLPVHKMYIFLTTGILSQLLTLSLHNTPFPQLNSTSSYTLWQLSGWKSLSHLPVMNCILGNITLLESELHPFHWRRQNLCWGS